MESKNDLIDKVIDLFPDDVVDRITTYLVMATGVAIDVIGIIERMEKSYGLGNGAILTGLGFMGCGAYALKEHYNARK